MHEILISFISFRRRLSYGRRRNERRGGGENGRKAGEIGIDAAIAGDLGIPTVLVTGDDKTCREAEEWIPVLVTCLRAPV